MIIPMRDQRGVAKPEARARSWVIVMGIALFLVLFSFDVELPLGSFASVSIWVVTATPLLVWAAAPRGNLGRALLMAAALSIFFILHQLLASQFTYGVPITRAITVGPVFAAGAALLFATSIHSSERLLSALVLAVKIFLVVQLSIMLLELTFSFKLVSLNDHPHYFLPIRRISGLFYEPSHLGVALATPLAMAIVYPRFWLRNFGALFTGALALMILLCPSTSLLGVIAIASLLRGLRSGGNAALVSIAAGVVIVGGWGVVYENRERDATALRIYDTVQALSGESPDRVNRSSMVLAKGIYIARRVLEEKPLGFGFDNASYANEDYGFEYGGRDWRENDKDLVSIYSKVVAEMGWLGLAALLLSIILLSRTSLKFGQAPIGIISMIALAILLSNMVRGSGYFSQGIVFTLAWSLVLLIERPVRELTGSIATGYKRIGSRREPQTPTPRPHLPRSSV